ncbi:MAG TPA: UDP-2,4-diacetamido-2,4,6-trideoxy-beta-L-altropyranose hydrolase [Ferruginibacter sp.]|nr:UDP-2,4-diacetamido-2,4,6-trideoxy-beta-L-altropyranose hydrolase [Ferruginibacter sp.]
MNETNNTIIFRADGGSAMGLGHMIRSTALAAGLKMSYRCIMATRCTVADVIKEINSVFDEIVHLPEIPFDTEAQDLHKVIDKDALIVLDGYSFDDTYQKALAVSGFDFFCIDDIHAYRFYSKTIINSAGGVSPLDYNAALPTQFFLGPRYALLRTVFLEAAKKRRVAVDNRNCFVCFGGADPENHTLRILRREKIKEQFTEFHVVVGSAYQNIEELKDYIGTTGSIFLYQSLPADEMVKIMRNCSYAICSASTIAYEYMCCGGVVFLKQTAPNQEDVMKYMLSQKLAFEGDDINNYAAEDIEQMLLKQAFYFDGNSGSRFIKIFDQYFEAKNLQIRRMRPEDLQTCFKWANDTEVRAQSYNSNQISLQDHSTWFMQKLTDPGCFYYLLELDNQPVAQIRFQVSNDEAVIGYMADKIIRSKGLGTTILSKGVEVFIKEFQKPVSIAGYVKASNIASQVSFERLAFKKEESLLYPDSFKYTMYHEN